MLSVLVWGVCRVPMFVDKGVGPQFTEANGESYSRSHSNPIFTYAWVLAVLGRILLLSLAYQSRVFGPWDAPGDRVRQRQRKGNKGLGVCWTTSEDGSQERGKSV